MRDLYKITFLFSFLFLFLLPIAAHSQLPTFTLNTTSVPETCPGNGSIGFTTTGTAAGSSVLYNIYQLPNAIVPIATLAANTLGGLTAGTYLVIATQTLGNQSNTQQQQVIVVNAQVELQYEIDLLACSNDGTVTVDVNQGTAVSYEIFAGPETYPSQTSNIFTGLPDGTYQIRVYDNCGEGVAQSFTLSSPVGAFSIASGTTLDLPLPSCNTIRVINQMTALPGAQIIYPLTLQYTVFPPSGTPIVVNATMLAGQPMLMNASSIIPFFHDQLYNYQLQITDGCGNVFNQNINPINEHIEVVLIAIPKECTKALRIIPVRNVAPFTVEFLSAPAGFDPMVYNGNHPGPFGGLNVEYYNTAIPLPAGIYIVRITDSCGRTATNTIVFDPSVQVNPLALSQLRGCQEGMGSMSASSSSGPIVSVVITSAPASYPNALPHDVSFNISQGGFFMNTLPEGNYTLHVVDQCNNVYDPSIAINGYHAITEVEVITSCDSFDLFLNHANNLTQAKNYFLQKFYTNSNSWGHPATGDISGEFPDSGLALINNNLHDDLNFTGTFRILVVFESIANGSSSGTQCIEELYTFESVYTSEISGIFQYACDPTSYDILIEATGSGPLIYRITTKDGIPFPVENGTSNLFTGLAPAIYNFQVEDSCGNLLNRLYDTTEPFAYTVTETGLCDGQDASLSVPNFEFLNYEWWHDNDPATILSTDATLIFSPFDAATNVGLYHVRIYAPDTTPSCIDFVMHHEVIFTTSAPNAGNGNALSLCGNPGIVDLFSYLQGSFDTMGTWSETSTSGTLTNNLWDATAVSAGVYEFRYLVNGWCNSSDEAVITITINQIPQTPSVVAQQQVCTNDLLELAALGAAEYSYSWSGPNGFSSNEQNPSLDNLSSANSGTYTVTATANGCDSPAVSIEVVVLELPEVLVESSCVNNVFTVEAISTAGFADGTSFSWTGPDNFSTTGNPAIITRQPAGEYSVTVTTEDGCSISSNIMVANTFCSIPLGISPNDDGDNDNFDLDGFDITNLKILNRYGMVVWEKDDYSAEWNGQDKNGNLLPTATYFYVANLGSGEAKTGWVYLMRK
ncbi:MAG TPA: gliding motility-associated C-terminal domain-containing protein [Flavobacterium sp.]|jgi:gliding motility-associated-like protein